MSIVLIFPLLIHGNWTDLGLRMLVVSIIDIRVNIIVVLNIRLNE